MKPPREPVLEKQRASSGIIWSHGIAKTRVLPGRLIVIHQWVWGGWQYSTNVKESRSSVQKYTLLLSIPSPVLRETNAGA